MSSDRTEEPTPRKLRQAREQGQVPRSRLWTGGLVMLGGSLGAALGAAGLRETLPAWTARLLGTDAPPAATALREALGLAVRAALPACIGALLAALAGSLAASGWAPRPAALAPRLDRLNPVAGLRRMFSLRGVTELLRGLLVALVVLLVVAAAVRGTLPDVLRAPTLEASAAAELLSRTTGRLWWRAVVLVAALGAFDLWRARARHRKELRMSREEVKREHREQEGDPRHKAHRRALHRALANAGRARGVESATVVVVNPVHVAVALRWAPDECDAPYLVAKGREADAADLRHRALALGIPLVRDVALARSLVLHDVGDEVPEELYRAAAAVLQLALERTELAGEERT